MRTEEMCVQILICRALCLHIFVGGDVLDAPKTVKINLCLRQHASTCLTGNENNAIMTNAYCGASRTSRPTDLCKHFHKSQFGALRGLREEQAPPLQVRAYKVRDKSQFNALRKQKTQTEFLQTSRPWLYPFPKNFEGVQGELF